MREVEGRIDISLTPFGAMVKEAYRALFPGDPGKAPAILKWRFLGNPHGQARFVLATDAGSPVGMIALVPTRLRNLPGSGAGAQAIDTVVELGHRRQGLLIRMGMLAQDADALASETLWGFPNRNSAPAWYGHLGWTRLGAVPLLMRPLRAGFFLRLAGWKPRAAGFPLIRERPAAGRVVIEPEGLTAGFAPLWDAVAPSLGTCVDRGGSWIRWRLAEKPGAAYRSVATGPASGGFHAFVSTSLANKHGARLCYVMEALSLPAHQAELTQLLLAELARAAGQGAEAALAWCPAAAPNYAAYRDAGFMPVPSWLRPIDIYMGARALVPEAAAAVRAGARWYVSFLDSDTN